jgi:hypothetical protein
MRRLEWPCSFTRGHGFQLVHRVSDDSRQVALVGLLDPAGWNWTPPPTPKRGSWPRGNRAAARSLPSDSPLREHIRCGWTSTCRPRESRCSTGWRRGYQRAGRCDGPAQRSGRRRRRSEHPGLALLRGVAGGGVALLSLSWLEPVGFALIIVGVGGLIWSRRRARARGCGDNCSGTTDASDSDSQSAPACGCATASR